MSRSDDLYALPTGIPVPVDDGACDHLVGAPVPSVPLPSTADRTVDLSAVAGRTVVYVYPRTGRPNQEPLPGWNETPGARGCTPQSCAFREHRAEIGGLGAGLFGLSTQDTAYQREAVERLRLPYELLSDASFLFVRALGLPEIEVAGQRFAQRVTLVLRDGTVEHVFYPVFPPDGNASAVAAWLRAHPETA